MTRLTASRQVARAVVQRRTVTMVPRLATEEEMKAEGMAQLRARVQYQKELMKQKDHGHEDIAEMWRWVNITFWVGMPICVLSFAYSMLFDEHPHRFEGELPEYMAVRNKPYPWECMNCDFFDLKCWKQCRADKKK